MHSNNVNVLMNVNKWVFILGVSGLVGRKEIMVEIL